MYSNCMMSGYIPLSDAELEFCTITSERDIGYQILDGGGNHKVGIIVHARARQGH